MRTKGDVEFIQGRMTWFVDGSNNFKPDEVYIPDEWTHSTKSQLVMARMLEEKGAFRMGIRGLYRRNFLIQNDLMFVPGLYSEDQEWTPRLFPLMSRWVVMRIRGICIERDAQDRS